MTDDIYGDFFSTLLFLGALSWPLGFFFMECSPISQAFFAFFTLFEIAIWADVVAWFLGILLVGSFALCWLFVSDSSTKVSIRGAPSASQSHPLIPYVQVSGTQILQRHRHRAFFVLFLHWNTRLCVLFLFLFLD